MSNPAPGNIGPSSTVMVRRYGHLPGDPDDPARPDGLGVVLRERATWTQLADDEFADEYGVSLPGRAGRWMLLSVAEPLADLTMLGAPPVLDGFGDVIDDGGQLDKPIDLYALPLAPGVKEITEAEAVALVKKDTARAARRAGRAAGGPVKVGG